MELSGLEFLNSDTRDLDLIFSLFGSAIAYQEKNSYERWPQFSQELIENEIAEKRHWKLVQGNSIAAVFSVLYQDPVIWDKADLEPSVYLHRIAVNPEYKGKALIGQIREWAILHARTLGKKYVRMDTWGGNENLRNYYIKNGFPYIGQKQLPEKDGASLHYGGSVLSLFQLEV